MDKGRKPDKVKELEDFYGIGAKRTGFGWILKRKYWTHPFYLEAGESEVSGLERGIKELELDTVKDDTVGKIDRSRKISFDGFWEKLAKILRDRQTIRNWTAFSSYIGDDFEAESQKDLILVYAPGISIQRIPKEDFKLVFDKWENYLQGNVKRSDFAHGAGSRYTKYTISIIHQFEEYMYGE